MSWRTLTLMAAMLAGVLAGCAYSAGADCARGCENAIADGCYPEGTNCEAACANFQMSYDMEFEVSRDVGCLGEYNDLYRCLAAADPCAMNPTCGSEANAVIACFLDACLDDPASPACN